MIATFEASDPGDILTIKIAIGSTYVTFMTLNDKGKEIRRVMIPIDEAESLLCQSLYAVKKMIKTNGEKERL